MNEGPGLEAAAYYVGQGQTVTAWAVSDLIASYFPGIAAPAEDRVDYRFINGFVDVGDLPCRKAFWSTMVGRELVADTSWPTKSLYLLAQTAASSSPDSGTCRPICVDG
ncbi:hypothetical protein AJ87_36980 [Rhizobium yanglingense]|nr:hypothetical protein AJ87_36980 [Rhizobium yanglingense]